MNLAKGLLFTFVCLALLVAVGTFKVEAAIDDCAPGYEFQASSGVGCVQINCASVPDAHYSYTSRCICGSAGSINEDPTDPNKGCYQTNDYASCPGCLYACVHTDEECPDEKDTTSTTSTNVSVNTNATVNANVSLNTNTSLNINQSTNQNTNMNVNIESASAPALTSSSVIGSSCYDECNKYLRGRKNAIVVSADGEPPNCDCQIDVQNGSEVSQTIKVSGQIQTTFNFDPLTGALLSRETINRQDEIEKIRQRLGYRYTEAEIDALLTPEKMDAWFQSQVKDIKTQTNMLHPQFWWQHLIAIFDHGFNGNSADFVDINQYGRCGDSMQWLERDLSNYLQLNDNSDQPGQKHEAILSITGEKYSNLLNHTSLLIRPQGISNTEWEDIVVELKAKSGGSKDNPGIAPGNLDDIDPRLLDAKVLDPYKKQVTTVREFIKGWSYIRIS